jgi:alkylation response protein AidB-like acyl-CoA dehydrogenase
MDLGYSAEQQMLADTVRRFIDREYSFEARRKLAGTDAGFSEDNWRLLADLGLLGLNVPEQFGGLGSGPVDTLIVMQALGRGLVVEPYLSTAVVGAALLSEAGSAEQKQAMLPGIVAGTRRLALAVLEPEGRFDLWRVATTATHSGDSYLLNGRKSVVLHGQSADTLIVSARTGGAVGDEAGISLFLVDARAPGVASVGFPTIDGQRCAEIRLSNVAVAASAAVGPVGAAYALLESTVDRGIAALCAEAVGAMERLIEITAEFLRTRKQFGKPLGSFQALQHSMADMLVALEQARSMALLAAARVGDPDPAERRRAVSAAKAMIGRCGRAIGERAVQLHGGMGMTDELCVGYYFKRLTCIDMTWGNTDHHVELYGKQLRMEPEDA